MIKEEIAKKLQAYCEQKGGQNKAANSIKGVSSATISQMLNGNWEKISDEMWRKVEAAIGGKVKMWRVAQTQTYMAMQELMAGVQEESRVLCITAPAGSGKTFASKEYEKGHRNVYRLSCDEFWSKNDFVEEMLRAMGVKYDGCTKREKLGLACQALAKKETPLLIFDEWDKLSDSVWQFFVTLYNKLEDVCGIVMLSTDYVEKRIAMGLKYQRKGYPEIWSRLGSKALRLDRADYEDVEAVCKANGIEDDGKIEDIARSAEGDLRRVRQLVFAELRK